MRPLVLIDGLPGSRRHRERIDVLSEEFESRASLPLNNRVFHPLTFC